MNPTNKDMDCPGAVCSGTGVFYQAMPAIGADGRNIMKLIPVQKVNGQFVQSQTSHYRREDVEPQRPITLNYAAAPIQIRSVTSLHPSANGQFVKKPHSYTNGSSNRVGETGRALASNLLAKMAQTASTTPNNEKLVTLASLPVTVKSPVLPNGQYLEIPPNAQVRTLSASELPPAIKKQIFTSSANSISNSSPPTVLYVSPVKTRNQGITPPSPPTPLRSPKFLSKSSDQTSFGPSSVGSTSSSRSIAKEPQRPNGPLKWVIEEGDGSLAPCLVPANSSIMTSEILKAVAERESANKPYENATKNTPIPQSSPPKGGQGKDNALVMCNGKVYFVAKKCNLPFRQASENAGAVNSDEYSQTNHSVKSLPSRLSNVSPASRASHMRRDSSHIIILDGDDVIDLCDDDSPDDRLRQAGSQPEEDNVIFVSYMPPQTPSTSGEQQSDVAQVNKKVIEQEVEKAVVQEITRSHGNGRGLKVVSVRGSTWRPSHHAESCRNIGTTRPSKVSEEVYRTQERTIGHEKQPSLSKSMSTDKSRGGASCTVMKNIETNNNIQKVNNKNSVATKQMESMAAPSFNREIKSRLHVDNIPNIHVHSSGPELRSIQSDGNGQKINTQHSVTTQLTECMDTHPIHQDMENIRHDDNTSGNTQANISGPEMGSIQSDGNGQKINNQHSVTTQQTESVDSHLIDQDMENSLHDDTNSQSGPCIQLEGEKHTVDISRDCLLRKMFGITSEVKIKLEIFREVPPQTASISNCTLEGVPKMIQESTCGMKKRQHEEPQGSQERSGDSCPGETKLLRLEAEPGASEDSAPSLQVDSGPLIKSNPLLEMKPLISPSSQMENKSLVTQSSPKESLCDGEFEHMFGYEEPLDEDFTSTADENHIPNSQDASARLQTETSGIGGSPGACCAEQSTKPKRRGRRKKCTVCPCGTTGTPVKNSKETKETKRSATKQKEPDLAKQKKGSIKPCKKKLEKCSVTPSATVIKTKRGPSSKAQRGEKSGAVGIQCLSARSVHSCRAPGEAPACNARPSTTSTDSEDIKRDEQIKRLQDLLKEKEAALETMRKSMG